jgi:hypothetical protein
LADGTIVMIQKNSYATRKKQREWSKLIEVQNTMKRLSK